MLNKRELGTLTVFRSAALAVCCVVGVQPLARLWFMGPTALPYVRLPMVDLARMFISIDQSGMFKLVIAGQLAGLVVFMLAFVRCTAPARPPNPRMTAALLALQIGLGALIESDLLFVMAAELALILPRRQALMGWGVQALVFIADGLWRLGQLNRPLLICNATVDTMTPPSPNQLAIGIYLSVVTGLLFQAVAFIVGRLAASESRRRARIAAARAGLSATRQLLLDAVRAAERLRVARELHDAVGHQLTAINLHLELALRQSGESAPAALYNGCKLARRLSADLRQVVRDEATSRKEQA